MKTPWDRIQEEYRAYLEASGYSADDFNDPSFKRADTFNSFSVFKQQQQQQQQQQQVLPVLMAMATANLDAWDRSSDARTRVESETVRETVLQFYGIRSRSYCQIAGAYAKNVVNAHIWPKGSKANLVLLDLRPDDIDDPRNILRLHKTLERYFDHKQLTFVESGRDKYILKVLDTSILSEQLENSHLIVSDVNGNRLKFHNESRPWRRILGLHSVMAHRYARKQGWVTDPDLTDAEINAHALINYSLDAEAQERLQLLLRE